MKIFKFKARATEINKLQFSEIEDYLEEKGLNVNEIFEMIADETEHIYVSNGFISALIADENETGEWHHYFKKDVDGYFIAGKLKFK